MICDACGKTMKLTVSGYYICYDCGWKVYP
jgi:DNA-directed RNA polymerase subunit RPC12/RpoP